MPAEVFGPGYEFLPRKDILDFEEIEKVTRVAVSLGASKIRLTGGEPLLRRDVAVLVKKLAAIPGVEDLAMTTNGTLLSRLAPSLAESGLDRVTVSLDALDNPTFQAMNGTGAKVERVLDGIQAARTAGLGVKINTVAQKGVNEAELIPLVRWAIAEELPLRFIEFMDVGETNGWDVSQVVPYQELVARIETEVGPTRKVGRETAAATALTYAVTDQETGKQGEIGFINSVTAPFCQNCSRLRLSADGRAFTCLFASEGRDLRPLLREGNPNDAEDKLKRAFFAQWSTRHDRYSELRGKVAQKKAEMSFLGG